MNCIILYLVLSLSYSDFKGPIPIDKPLIAAETYTGLSMDADCQGDICYFKVTPVFYSDKSWIRVKSGQILRHENQHWLIAVLMAEKCNRELQKVKSEKKAEKILNKYSASINRINKIFDVETNHGLGDVMEGIYELNITKQINKLFDNEKRGTSKTN